MVLELTLWKARKRAGQLEKLSCSAVQWNILTDLMGNSEARMTLQKCSIEVRKLAF